MWSSGKRCITAPLWKRLDTSCPENTLGPERAGLNRADGDQPAARAGPGLRCLHRSIAPAYDHRVAEPHAACGIVRKDDLRQAVESGCGTEKIAIDRGEALFLGRRLRGSLLQRLQRNELRWL